MAITLEQARALDAIAESGSFLAAAMRLGKRHSALLYALKSLESQTGLKILDRTKYRTGLTPVGRRVWEECRRILAAEKNFDLLCSDLTAGWEPYLKIVTEGIIPIEPILRSVEALSRRKIPTRVQVFSEFHRGVEESFHANEAQLMISVLPPTRSSLESRRLAPLRALLVAHADHPLNKESRGRKALTTEDLREHLFLTVRGSDTRLNLSTSALEQESAFHLNDFYSKRLALLKGIGYGWMPEYLIQKELRGRKLRVIRWENPSAHVFHPHLYFRGDRQLGRAARIFIDELCADRKQT